MRIPAAALALAVLTTSAGAQVRTFPYEATVVSETAAVHSGPGGRYYATGQIQRGMSVTVYRHDPGGWYMIAPPPGSFSWIRAEYVRRIDPDRGELTANNVVVRVGSSLDDSHQVEQVRLSTGDRVEILGEAQLNTGPGTTQMFKIRPPRGEFRWIQGRDLVPATPGLREEHDRDPFAVPSTVRRPEAGSGNASVPVPGPTRGRAPAASGGQSSPPGFDRPITRSSGPAVRQTGPSPDRLAADRSRLEQLDGRFRSLIEQDIDHWDFTGLEHDYQQLRAAASLPALASQVQLRLEAIERYRQRQRKHHEVMRLISETSRRDAELRAAQTRQRGPAALSNTRPAGPAAVVEPGSVPADRWQGTVPGPFGRALPAQPNLRAAAPVQTPRFDGAGILQRAATTYAGAPRYVLLAPNGRVLAYIEAARGINLEAWIGRSVGVVGPRQQRRDLQADLIIVQNLLPVRLVPAP